MLDNLSDKLQSIFSGLRSKGKLNEDDINSAMKEIRMALLEADVNFKVVKSFIKNTKERCLDAEVLDSLTPAQNVIKVVLDELTKLLGESDSQLVLSSRIPNVIMLVGLQGSGKTTAAAKLAYLLKKQNHNPLLVACDVYRPAAADQLQTLGDEIGVRVYRGDGKDPVKIAQEGVRDTVDSLRDVVIVDTAGRLHVDEEMMAEAAAIRDAVEPGEKRWSCRLAGKSCLAGDVIGEYSFDEPLKAGDRLVFTDMAIYSMVKTTTFNGLRLPSIVRWNPETDGTRLVREFGYEDFKMRLS